WMRLVRPITVEPAGAPEMKLVLLSMVVVPRATAGRLMKAAVAPSVSAKLMIAPPCAMAPIVQRSGLIVMRAASASLSALMNSIPSNWANGSGLAAMRSISDMPLPLLPGRRAGGSSRLGIASARDGSQAGEQRADRCPNQADQAI